MKNLFICTLIVFSVSYAKAAEHTFSTSQVVKELNEISALRDNLAGAIDKSKNPVTPETFKATCAPVGKRLKIWATDKGYQAKQVSQKYRNPQHAPDTTEESILEQFKAQPQLPYISQSDEKGTHLYVPIYITQGCLNCHGPKDQRPAFVEKKYTQDKAFDFKVQDLRGMYSVFIAK